METITKEEVIASNEKTYIYYLKHNGKIVYVGQSHSLMFRLVEHSKGKKRLGETLKEWDECDYYQVEPKMANYQESLDIIKHRPKYNKQIPLSPKEFGLTSETKLPDWVNPEMKEGAHVIDLFGTKYYDLAILLSGVAPTEPGGSSVGATKIVYKDTKI